MSKGCSHLSGGTAGPPIRRVKVRASPVKSQATPTPKDATSSGTTAFSSDPTSHFDAVRVVVCAAVSQPFVILNQVERLKRGFDLTDTVVYEIGTPPWSCQLSILPRLVYASPDTKRSIGRRSSERGKHADGFTLAHP